ncbi:hypothetical protein [Bordetella petrii]|uniref:hypothetical protein n=1 Tax=Bordetella petrii TaxID=94624 RepID=UPI001A97BE9F|nr:hypothetical protein [Bordetella petrii]MBO1111841.1 hypothetical protein [Bordetella petrii]
MALFTDWNSLLLSEYFSLASSHEEAWIHANRADLDAFGLHLGGADGLVEAARQGPEWIPASASHCGDVVRQLINLRRANLRSNSYIDPGAENPIYEGLKAPTYLPYLALWVLASSEAGEEGFYAKVTGLLKQPFPNTPPVTSVMEAAWQDLERWSKDEIDGRFGIFRFRKLGEHRFVGISKSQCMVSSKDANGIRQLFAACGLHPKQALTHSLFRQVIDQGKDVHYLSSTLKSAMQDPAYHEPLQHVLAELLDIWDGRRPRAAEGQHGRNHDPQDVGGPGPTLEDCEDEVKARLIPSFNDVDGWEIGWRFPAAGGIVSCTLVHGSNRIPAKLDPMGDAFNSDSAGHQDVARDMLQKSTVEDIVLDVEYGDENSPGLGGRRRYRIHRKDRRFFSWDMPNPRSIEELVERDLPILGPAYILSTDSFREILDTYLRNEGIPTEQLTTGGLPSNWALTCIPDSAQLNEEQRQWLEDRSALPGARARLRFVGGRSIIQGRTRTYAPYDLPMVELEAPRGAILMAEGLEFSDPGMRAERSQIRRLSIRVTDERKAGFEIRVISDSEILAKAKLRLVLRDGLALAQGRALGLDRFGRTVLASEGLSGVIIQSGQSEDEHRAQTQVFNLAEGMLCQDLGSNLIQGVSAKFLDSLASLGSIPYGAARDQLTRLGESDGIDVQPVFALLDLRSRGCLELQTDARGHLIRVLAVPPTVYSLPAMHDGLALHGVCGTLRLKHWECLRNDQDIVAYIEQGREWRLPVLRLASIDEESIRKVVDRYGLLFARNPSVSISKWAGPLEEATSELAPQGWSGLAANLRQLQRLVPNSAQFSMVSSGFMAVDPQVGRQLFKFDDPATPGLQVYALGSRLGNGPESYNFIHDSRWGVWIAINAFAKWVKKHHSIEDASPWPIHYAPQQGELWLPARLRPPAMIERALTTCSGSSAVEVCVTPGFSDETGLFLVEGKTEKIIGLANHVYGGFVPGVWLCYRWVPLEIATRVAGLLEGQLSSF